jgi:nitrate reductase cytochrome c-type subunit
LFYFLTDSETVKLYSILKMVSQKFVTLSALVLVFAVIATNVGQTNGEKKESKEEEEKDKRMAILSLCGQ